MRSRSDIGLTVDLYCSSKVDESKPRVAGLAGEVHQNWKTHYLTKTGEVFIGSATVDQV